MNTAAGGTDLHADRGVRGLRHAAPVGDLEPTAATPTATAGTASTAITVNPVAEPPARRAAPATLTLNENATNVAITGVSVGPLAEDSDDTVSAVLAVTHGTLHVGSLSGVTVSQQRHRLGDGGRQRGVGEHGAGGTDLYADRGIRGLRHAAT